MLYKLFFHSERLSRYCKEQFKLQQNASNPDLPPLGLIANNVYGTLFLRNIDPSTLSELRLTLTWSWDMQQDGAGLMHNNEDALDFATLRHRPTIGFDPKAVCLQRRDILVILLWFPRHLCSGKPHPIPLYTKRSRTPLFQNKLPPALDDNTSTGQLCILPWCRRWSVNDQPSLIWGGGTFDLSLICQCLLFNFVSFYPFSRGQS